MLYTVFAILAGVCVAMQNSLNGLMTPIVGAMGTSLAIFVIQTVLLVAYQLIREKRMADLHNVPVGYYSSGFIAAFVVGTIGVCVARMGSAVTTCCSVAGQIIMSSVVDHFGMFGTKKDAFRLRRVPGFALILAGVLAINLIGGNASGDATLPMLALALALGACAVIVRTLNARATALAGSVIGGGIVNSLSGAVAGLLFFLVLSGFRPDFAAFARVPLYDYTGAFFGLACLLLNIVAYRKMKVFYATIFMLVGQVAAGVLMDVLVFHSLSAGKCIGIAIVLAGVAIDKVLTRQN